MQAYLFLPEHVACLLNLDAATGTPGTPKSQPTATPKPNPVVFKTSGNGQKRTATFHVVDASSWTLHYDCRNTTSLNTFPFYVTVYTSDGSYYDQASYTCTRTYGGSASRVSCPAQLTPDYGVRRCGGGTNRRTIVISVRPALRC